MTELLPLFQQPTGRLPNAGVFLSGSGSNAERLLEALEACPRPPLRIPALITDSPETSRAREIGSAHHLPVVECDIHRFYRERGETRISILTERGQQLREEWTNQLRQAVAPLALDFGVFAGFVPLTNLTADLPCLNVHPGDLTYLKDGKRLFVGLHTIPIERAILEGLDYLRSSVLIVEPYSGKGDSMDNGLLLGVSAPVPILLDGFSREALHACAAARPERRPKGGWQDDLERVALLNQDNLKRLGDWSVLPPVVFSFASGNYATDGHGGLFYKGQPVLTVEFSPDGTARPIPRMDLQAGDLKPGDLTLQ